MVAAKYKALVVDDEEPIRRLLKRALSREGIEADEAADGRQALNLYQARKYDVVITDLRMPNRHGHALCVDLLQDPGHPLIIVLTGVLEPRLARDLFARGVDDVVFKPVDFRSFATKVRALLEARSDQSSGAAGVAAATAPPPQSVASAATGTQADAAPPTGSATAATSSTPPPASTRTPTAVTEPASPTRSATAPASAADGLSQSSPAPPQTPVAPGQSPHGGPSGTTGQSASAAAGVVAAPAGATPAGPATAQAEPSSSAAAAASSSPTPAPNAAPSASPGAAAPAPTGKPNLILLLCRDPRRHEQLPPKLVSDDTDVVACETSEELYRWLRERRVDLVILEQQLDGFLTGLDVLEKMHTDLLRPDAILIGDLDADDMERIDKLGIEVTFPTDVDDEQVVEAVQRLLQSRNTSDPLIPSHARKLVELYEDIPVLPQLLTKLLGYMNMPSEEIPLKKLADEISVDSRATAEILKLTNSPVLGLGQRVVRVMDAVNLLGPKRTISLILSSAAMHAQSELLKGWSEPIRLWYHHRSVLIASMASVFAKRVERISPNTAFTLGLLQDIGVLVLANRGRQRYLQSIVGRARSIGHLDLAALEEEAFKLNHGEVSAAVLDRWQLPQSLIRPVLFHHRDDSEEECDATEKAFLRVMKIGEALADLADVSHPSRRMRLNRLLLHYGPKQASLCRECIELGAAKAREACQLFSVPPPTEEELQTLVQRAHSAAS